MLFHMVAGQCAPRMATGPITPQHCVSLHSVMQAAVSSPAPEKPTTRPPGVRARSQAVATRRLAYCRVSLGYTQKLRAMNGWCTDTLVYALNRQGVQMSSAFVCTPAAPACQERASAARQGLLLCCLVNSLPTTCSTARAVAQQPPRPSNLHPNGSPHLR